MTSELGLVRRRFDDRSRSRRCLVAHAQVLKNLPSDALWISGKCNEQVLGPNVVMSVLRGDAFGTTNRLLDARCPFHLCADIDSRRALKGDRAYVQRGE